MRAALSDSQATHTKPRQALLPAPSHQLLVSVRMSRSVGRPGFCWLSCLALPLSTHFTLAAVPPACLCAWFGLLAAPFDSQAVACGHMISKVSIPPKACAGDPSARMLGCGYDSETSHSCALLLACQPALPCCWVCCCLPCVVVGVCWWFAGLAIAFTGCVCVHLTTKVCSVHAATRGLKMRPAGMALSPV